MAALAAPVLMIPIVGVFVSLTSNNGLQALRFALD
jgi:hypothetical protein